MGFFVLGLNHKECPIEIREKLHFDLTRLDQTLLELKAGAGLSETVILSTCNRVELYGFTEKKEIPEEPVFAFLERTHLINRDTFAQYFYRYEGEQAFRHVFRVAAGLDSMVVGENEILGQLREAFRAANRAGTAHSLLYRLMEKALKIGKDVRNKTKINQGAVSIPAVAMELAEKIFGQLAGEKIMVLGTGEMGTATLKTLRSAGAEALFVVSRSQERGEKVATEFGAEWISLQNWDQKMSAIDILVASTASQRPVVTYDHIKQIMALRKHRPLFLIDIAVPRNIDPRVHTIDDVYLYNLDDLKGVSEQNLKHRLREIESAETMVDQAVLGFRSWLAQLEARPTLERFEGFLNDILDQELGTLTEDSNLQEDKKNQIRDRIRTKLLHAPHKKIKESAQNGGVTRYLEALHSLFDLENKQEQDDS